jgi:hypothetical protein
MWKKESARSMLTKGEKEVIPVLIAALQDGRTFDPEYLSPTASPDSKPRILTVGRTCEQIREQVISGGEVRRYYVSDWEEWWEKNKTKTLYEIILMVRANSTTK